MIIGITGANGYIGRYLAEQLEKSGKYKVIVFVRSSKAVSYFGAKGISVCQCDLEDHLACSDLIAKVDSVIHLAHSGYPLSETGNFTERTVKNLTPTLNLLESIRVSCKNVRLVYASSGGTVYSQRNTQRPFEEVDNCAPASPYGIEKYSLENYIQYYSATYGFESIIYRLSNPYGVLVDTERKQGLIGVALNNIINNEPVRIYGNPNNVRDYVHLDDVVRAIDLGLTTPGSGGVYNIGSGVGYSVCEIIDKLEEKLGLRVKREYFSSMAAEKLPKWVVLDTAKARKVFGWEPFISLDEGLDELCKSVKIL
jgi:UDP-glucose 4-epimerase